MIARTLMVASAGIVLCLGLVCLAGGDVASVCAAQTENILQRLQGDPSLLRDHRTLKRLMRTEPGSYQAQMIRIAGDSGTDWDLRSRALTLVTLPETEGPTAAFVEDFDPQKVAADEFGAESFNILADWLRGCANGPPSVKRLLVPVRKGADVAPVLQSLAGHPLHPYLRWLAETDYHFTNGEITAVAATDDQLTRQFLSWLVGAEQATRGSLRVTRCWGADLEGPGDWARAVSELGLHEAIPAISSILDGPWNDEAAEALSTMGSDGAKALARFLLTPAAVQLDHAHRDTAVAACARNLDPAAWAQLRAHLLTDPVLAASLP
jgi:hypothetical protein